MSLINKMLQDLDARGGAAGGALNQQELKAVPVLERDKRPLLLLGAAGALVLLAVGGWMGWRYWQSQAKTAVVAPAVRVIQPPPVAAAAAAQASTPAAEGGAVQASAPAASQTATPPAKPAPAPAAVQPATAAAPAPAAAAAGERAAPARAGDAVVDKAADKAAVAERKAARPRNAKAGAEAASAAAANTAPRDLSPAQMAENTYRRALVALQEGRLSAALADLDRALEIDPRNEPARQTYVSLLLENKRPDDAIRQLRLALGIDPRQPGLAMVLARLQLERGGPALDTLMRTLPYAGSNAEYQAFVAGVLQREQRHGEAAAHYREALTLSPQNGVWWMGLAISLQADKLLPEAREAYTRAKGGSGMTPELLAFIDRKLEQLAR